MNLKLSVLLVFEARWSEVEWMINKNIDRKEGADIPDQEGEFVSSFYLNFWLILLICQFLFLYIAQDKI